jgi:hypothetical protein
MKKYVLLLAAACVMALTWSHAARAQNTPDEVTNNGAKGAVGLGLLAMELTVNIEAAAGVKKAWVLAVTGLVAAGAGAAGGYFAETKPSPDTGAQVGVGLLAGGMAMLVPTMIIATALTKYRGRKEAAPEVEVVTESAPAAEAEAGAEVEEAPAETETPEEAPAEEESPEEPATALLNVSKKRVSLAVPPVIMAPVFSEDEIGVLTDEQETEYRINLINLVF